MTKQSPDPTIERPPQNNERRDIERVLGEPFLDEFPDHLQKIRRNLVVTAFVALIFTVGGIGISQESSFFGIRLDGLDDEKLREILFILVAYLLMSFFWNSLNHLHEGRLRLTGTSAFFTAGSRFSSPLQDHPRRDKRQSTLYNYLLELRYPPDDLREQFSTLKEKIPNWSKNIGQRSMRPGDPISNESLQAMTNNLHNELLKLEGYFNYLDRIPVSLRRFERWFLLFQVGQIARWVFLELGLPFGLGIWAVIETYPF